MTPTREGISIPLAYSDRAPTGSHEAPSFRSPNREISRLRGKAPIRRFTFPFGSAPSAYYAHGMDWLWYVGPAFILGLFYVTGLKKDRRRTREVADWLLHGVATQVIDAPEPKAKKKGVY